MKYIDAEKLKAQIKQRRDKYLNDCLVQGHIKAAELDDLLPIIDSLHQDETQADRVLCSKIWWEEQGWIMIPPDATLEGIDSLLKQVRKKLQQEEQPRSRFVQVKCIHPFDESWEVDKVYTCEVWHHGDLNMDFWDVYYDYANNPRYVQFPTIEMLNKEFVIIQQKESAEVVLEKELEAYANLYPTEDAGSYRNLINIASHFYELGLKERKEETK